MKQIVACAIVSVAALTGCTTRGIDTTLTPQIYGNGEIIYVYSDHANVYQPDADADAEKLRLRDLQAWMSDSKACVKGYEIIKRESIALRAWSDNRKVYYFIKCK